MRRAAPLAVDTQAANYAPSHFSRASSTSSLHKGDLEFPPSPLDNPPPVIPTKPYKAPNPSIFLLFSLCTRRDVFSLLLPAVLVSFAGAAVAPIMTQVIGAAFDAFAAFPLTPNPPQEARDALLHGIGIAALQLIGLSGAALLFSSLSSSLWIWVGERNVKRLRKRVYDSVTTRDMEWFDLKMGGEEGAKGGEEKSGAGGMMAKFASDTDDVRMASSLNMGLIVQYIATFIASLVLALRRSYQLTLVILCSIPIMVLIQVFSQGFSVPLYAAERAKTASVATRMDRAIASIMTVKAFNAAARESVAADKALEEARIAARKCTRVWAISSGTTQFVLLGMFVTGFWYGAQLVREGKVSPGDVLAVFWACLIASSNLGMCIPLLVIYAKGKAAMVTLSTLIDPPPAGSDSSSHGARGRTASLTPLTPRFTALRKIRPSKCQGEFHLRNVSFAYPSRPSVPVLSDVSIFIPAGETTFIVGGSGSGKSTIAQLLLRLYDAQNGSIELDDQTYEHLDETWTREHIAAVSQGCILFDLSVHDNVALGLAGTGRKPSDATREEVTAACRAALMHEFVRDLPDGYDTILGKGGANLSGGQKQRLAIARARMRDPTVLILDEATSALDATSRLLVFEAIKTWRKNRTTIVITHDLSQIGPSDFVYLLKDGQVIEQGFRADLEDIKQSEFRSMMDKQGASGGFPVKEDPEPYELTQQKTEKVEAILEHTEEARTLKKKKRHTSKHQSLIASITNNWMLDAISDLTRSGPVDPDVAAKRAAPRSAEDDDEGFNTVPRSNLARRSSLNTSGAAPAYSVNRRSSLQFTPISPTAQPKTFIEDDEAFEREKEAVQQSGEIASMERVVKRKATKERLRWDDKAIAAAAQEKEKKAAAPTTHPDDKPPSVFQVIREFYPTVPNKLLVLFGLVVCLINGAITPVFAFLLSRLIVEMTAGGTQVSTITLYGVIVVCIAIADGITCGTKFFVLEVAAMNWVTSLRKKCFGLVLAQDKSWFDESRHSAEKLVQILVKDGDDARTLIATIIGQFVVVVAMLGVGLIWALVRGWQLTLVGFAIGPVFAIAMIVQSAMVAKFERRNKRAREDVAKQYYDAVSNMRGIRSMALEGVFRDQFDKALTVALKSGVKGAFAEGLGYGIAGALIYLAEAIIFYVGAILIANGTYSYLQMIEVLNLVVFSVSIASQILAFVQRTAKSVQATRDFGTLLALDTNTSESQGKARFRIQGDIAFEHVAFSYPQRADVPILKDVSFKLTDGESVAIVGGSGSGKSTIAALLQRLYEPNGGKITIKGHALSSADVIWLREHVAVVNQHPHLFDASIADNIGYGPSVIPFGEIERAAKEANVHDFIMSLPKGYDTMVGENASLISGGQAQRIQIARALVRTANILILDECTSALDPANQAAIMKTIQKVKRGRTTVVVTHKLPVMRMCDRIIVVNDGVIAEEGTYESLMARRGTFFTLASGGEWSGE